MRPAYLYAGVKLSFHSREEKKRERCVHFIYLCHTMHLLWFPFEMQLQSRLETMRLRDGNYICAHTPLAAAGTLESVWVLQRVVLLASI